MLYKKRIDESQEAVRVSILENFMRVLTVMQNAVEKPARRNFFNSAQYPKEIIEVKELLNTIRAWVEKYKIHAKQAGFTYLTGSAIQQLISLTGELTLKLSPVRGKKVRREVLL